MTGQVDIARIDRENDEEGDNNDDDGDRDRSRGGRRQEDVLRITNDSSSIVDTHLLIVVQGLSNRVQLENRSGITSTGQPYLRVFLRDGVLLPDQSIVRRLRFRREPGAPPVTYTLKLLSGQGTP